MSVRPSVRRTVVIFIYLSHRLLMNSVCVFNVVGRFTRRANVCLFFFSPPFNRFGKARCRVHRVILTYAIPVAAIVLLVCTRVVQNNIYTAVASRECDTVFEETILVILFAVIRVYRYVRSPQLYVLEVGHRHVNKKIRCLHHFAVIITIRILL